MEKTWPAFTVSQRKFVMNSTSELFLLYYGLKKYNIMECNKYTTMEKWTGWVVSLKYTAYENTTESSKEILQIGQCSM